MIEKWEFVHSPFEKDSQRHKLRLRASKEDVLELLEKIPAQCGHPFVTLSRDFNWAFYVYACSDSVRQNVVGILEEVISKNKVLTPVQTGETCSAPEIKQSRAEPFSTDVSEFQISGEDSFLNSHFLFSEFVTTSKNRFAVTAAQVVADHPGKIYNPFLICGNKGTGKTHLMHAVGHRMILKKPQTQILILSAEKLFSEIRQAFQKKSLNAFRNRFRLPDVLMVDDIQWLSENSLKEVSSSEEIQEEFLYLLNLMEERGKQVLLTSGLSLQLLHFRERLKIRLQKGLSVNLPEIDLETHKIILRKKSELTGFDLGEEEIDLIARKSSHLKESEEWLKKIHSALQQKQDKIETDFLKKLIGEKESVPDFKPAEVPAEKKETSVPEEKKAVAEHEPLKEKIKMTEPSTEKESVPELAQPEEVLKVAILPDKKEEERQITGIKKNIAGSSPEKEEKNLSEAKEIVIEFPHQKKELTVSEKKSENDKLVINPIVPDPPPLQKQPLESVLLVPVQKAEKIREPVLQPQLMIEPSQSVPLVSQVVPLVLSPVTEKAPVPAEELTPLQVVGFYPKLKEKEFEIFAEKLNGQIEKFKLKIRLERLLNKSYDVDAKLDYSFFVNECCAQNCPVALVLGPPTGSKLSVSSFTGQLSSWLEKEKISLHLLLWDDLSKDASYLSCALELSLLSKAKK